MVSRVGTLTGRSDIPYGVARKLGGIDSLLGISEETRGEGKAAKWRQVRFKAALAPYRKHPKLRAALLELLVIYYCLVSRNRLNDDDHVSPRGVGGAQGTVGGTQKQKGRTRRC